MPNKRAPRAAAPQSARAPRAGKPGAKPAPNKPVKGARPPRRDERPRPARPAAAPAAEESPRDIVYGRHAVLAALEGESPINKVWVLNGLSNPQIVARVRQMAKEKGATVQMVERPKLDALTLDANHQGLVASIAAASYTDLDELIALALEAKYPALLVLDGIEDPHNLGALLRTAEAAEFVGVVIPARRAVGITPVVLKTSAGAASRLPVARVGNLAQAVDTLKKAGFWLLGADATGESLPYDVEMTRAIALVIGGEGKGLSRLLRDKCDYVVKLPLGGEMESLNASVAGGVLMYEAVRQRLAQG